VNNGNIKEAIEKASRYATLSVTREGTQDSYADVADFTEYMKSQPVTM
jgi:sugar/nucleoside kinase (ribokinase family)